MQHNLDIFSPVNFLTVPIAKTMLKSVTQPTDKVGASGDVTFDSCPDDTGVFTFDESSTTFAPMPLTKGSHINLNLAGIVSDTITQSNVHVHVDWNGTTLYD